MKNYKFYSLLFIIMIISQFSQAQFSQAELQVSGLTCSMCSFATQKQLKTINFIDSLWVDLKKTTFFLRFSPNKKIDLDEIRQKVESAGFYVAHLIIYTNEPISQNSSITNLGGQKLVFVENKATKTQKLRILNEGFVTKKEYKKKNNSLITKVVKTDKVYYVQGI